MGDLNFGGVMITCPGRAGMLTTTLGNLRECAPELRLWVQMDETTYERRQERQEHNSLAALVAGLGRFPEANVLLFFEDDLVFNRHFLHNLLHWKPLGNVTGLVPDRTASPHRDHFFGSLYDPSVRRIKTVSEEHYFIADPNAVYGSQAFIMSRAMAEYFVAHWWEVPGMQDIKMSRMAMHSGPIYYHQPSLVQHAGVKSTWTQDARFHTARSFDREFKAGF